MKNLSVVLILLTFMMIGCAPAQKIVEKEITQTKEVVIPRTVTEIDVDENSKIEDYITTGLYYVDQKDYTSAISILSYANQKLNRNVEYEAKVRLNLVLLFVALKAGEIQVFNQCRTFLDNVNQNEIKLIDVKNQLIAVKKFNAKYGGEK